MRFVSEDILGWQGKINRKILKLLLRADRDDSVDRNSEDQIHG